MWRLPAILVTALALVGGSVASGGTAVALPGGPGLDHDMRVITGYFNDHPMHRGEFGGLSFVQGHPGTLHVMIADDPLDRPYPWETDVANPDQSRVHRAAFSYRYLRGIQRQVGRFMEAQEPQWAKRVCGVGVDQELNVVVIQRYTGRAPVGFWDRLSGVFPRRAIDLETGCPIEGA